MRRYVIDKVTTTYVERITDELLEGTHEGYSTYVAIKVDRMELGNHNFVLKADM
jgi:hypothetical protein